jgi:hypothetical protein
VCVVIPGIYLRKNITNGVGATFDEKLESKQEINGERKERKNESTKEIK